MPAASNQRLARQGTSASGKKAAKGPGVAVSGDQTCGINTKAYNAYGDGATLQQLREEDKRKVANLIQQVVQLGSRVKELEHQAEPQQTPVAITAENAQLRHQLAFAVQLLRRYQNTSGQGGMPLMPTGCPTDEELSTFMSTCTAIGVPDWAGHTHVTPPGAQNQPSSGAETSIGQKEQAAKANVDTKDADAVRETVFQGCSDENSKKEVVTHGKGATIVAPASPKSRDCSPRSRASTAQPRPKRTRHSKSPHTTPRSPHPTTNPSPKSKQSSSTPTQHPSKENSSPPASPKPPSVKSSPFAVTKPRSLGLSSARIQMPEPTRTSLQPPMIPPSPRRTPSALPLPTQQPLTPLPRPNPTPHHRSALNHPSILTQHPHPGSCRDSADPSAFEPRPSPTAASPPTPTPQTGNTHHIAAPPHPSTGHPPPGATLSTQEASRSSDNWQGRSHHMPGLASPDQAREGAGQPLQSHQADTAPRANPPDSAREESSIPPASSPAPPSELHTENSLQEPIRGESSTAPPPSVGAAAHVAVPAPQHVASAVPDDGVRAPLQHATRNLVQAEPEPCHACGGHVDSREGEPAFAAASGRATEELPLSAGEPGTAEAQGNAAAPAEGLPRGVHAAERPLPRSRDGAAAADTAAESPSRPAVDQPVDRGGPSPDAGDRRGLEDAWDRGRSVSVGLSPSECARPWSPEVVVPDVSFGGDGDDVHVHIHFAHPGPTAPFPGAAGAPSAAAFTGHGGHRSTFPYPGAHERAAPAPHFPAAVPPEASGATMHDLRDNPAPMGYGVGGVPGDHWDGGSPDAALSGGPAEPSGLAHWPGHGGAPAAAGLPLPMQLPLQPLTHLIAFDDALADLVSEVDTMMESRAEGPGGGRRRGGPEDSPDLEYGGEADAWGMQRLKEWVSGQTGACMDANVARGVSDASAAASRPAPDARLRRSSQVESRRVELSEGETSGSERSTARGARMHAAGRLPQRRGGFQTQTLLQRPAGRQVEPKVAPPAVSSPGCGADLSTHLGCCGSPAGAMHVAAAAATHAHTASDARRSGRGECGASDAGYTQATGTAKQSGRPEARAPAGSGDRCCPSPIEPNSTRAWDRGGDRVHRSSASPEDPPMDFGVRYAPAHHMHERHDHDAHASGQAYGRGHSVGHGHDVQRRGSRAGDGNSSLRGNTRGQGMHAAASGSGTRGTVDALDAAVLSMLNDLF